MTLKQIETYAWEAGLDSHKTGVTENDNPYDKGTQEYDAWDWNFKDGVWENKIMRDDSYLDY